MMCYCCCSSAEAEETYVTVHGIGDTADTSLWLFKPRFSCQEQSILLGLVPGTTGARADKRAVFDPTLRPSSVNRWTYLVRSP
jgi:hypothetical protein